jgi:hypothetical protein
MGLYKQLVCYTVWARSHFVPMLHSSVTSIRPNCRMSLQTRSGTYMHLYKHIGPISNICCYFSR